VTLLSEFVALRPSASAADCVGELLAGPLAERGALLRHYSEERLMSVAARRGWLEPDRAPLRLGDPPRPVPHRLP
jgi:hypothetical protein